MAATGSEFLANISGLQQWRESGLPRIRSESSLVTTVNDIRNVAITLPPSYYRD
jgi:hypothetical protein